MRSVTWPVVGLTSRMREEFLGASAPRIPWRESLTNRRPPLKSCSNAIPIVGACRKAGSSRAATVGARPSTRTNWPFWFSTRSEEHTSELQSRVDLVCRLLLEKKNEIDEHRTTLQKSLA